MVKNEIVECKLPKGKKWSDPEVIKMTSPYSTKHGGTFYNEYGKYCYFYPIENDLYIKGMFSHQKKVMYQSRFFDTPTPYWILDKNAIVKLTNYKNLTAIEACEIVCGCTSAESMIHTVWNKLGLRQGYMVPILKDLN